MANVDYFLKIDGVPGESKDAQHPGEIDLESFTWSESLAGGGGTGGGGAGKVTMQPFQCSMRVSKASPALFLACASGKHFKTAVVSVRRRDPKSYDFLRWTLSDTLVSAYHVSGVETPDGIPRDQVSLTFTRIQVEYFEQEADGSVGQPSRAGWDLTQNKAI